MITFKIQTSTDTHVVIAPSTADALRYRNGVESELYTLPFGQRDLLSDAETEFVSIQEQIDGNFPGHPELHVEFNLAHQYNRSVSLLQELSLSADNLMVHSAQAHKLMQSIVTLGRMSGDGDEDISNVLSLSVHPSLEFSITPDITLQRRRISVENVRVRRRLSTFDLGFIFDLWVGKNSYTDLVEFAGHHETRAHFGNSWLMLNNEEFLSPIEISEIHQILSIQGLFTSYVEFIDVVRSTEIFPCRPKINLQHDLPRFVRLEDLKSLTPRQFISPCGDDYALMWFDGQAYCNEQPQVVLGPQGLHWEELPSAIALFAEDVLRDVSHSERDWRLSGYLCVCYGERGIQHFPIMLGMETSLTAGTVALMEKHNLLLTCPQHEDPPESSVQ